MEKVIKWGIIGCGHIAPKFIEGINVLENTKVVAVASKSIDKASDLAKRHDIEYFYDDYEQLITNPEVDVIYIATSHNFHKENILQCLKHKKPVLCEKAFTVNGKEAELVINYAREQKVFLMEAMWTRYLPCIKEVKRLIESGIIGEVRNLEANFGFISPFNPEGRLYNKQLAGGSLLDVGIYPVSFAYYIFEKEPINIKSSAKIGVTGVDEQTAIIFTYNDGAMAQLASSMTLQMSQLAVITGTKGIITLKKFHRAVGYTLQLNDEEPQEVSIPFESTGYNYEAQEVINCLNNGKLESEIMPLNETLQIMRCMDQIRADWGVEYDADLE